MYVCEEMYVSIFLFQIIPFSLTFYFFHLISWIIIIIINDVVLLLSFSHQRELIDF